MTVATNTGPASATVLSPELRLLAGWVSRPVTREVTAESVRRFAGAISPASLTSADGSPVAPLQKDIAPPTYFCPDPVVEVQAMGLVRPSYPTRSIDGRSQWAPGRPVRPGDTLTSIGRVTQVTQRNTRDGRDMVETRFEVLVWNQDGLSVGVAGGTIINYQERLT